ncbi:hypothetical protein PNEG_00041 [Pneumocystis murina B123]|uniref:Uncharacterized protein n=1 Tax=Pneumocystis murina (strain B123) TaxID=1069680 RepID=M7PM96_PNEMU|nr:hypothetical protein PNEG_00041 [Pneumocystis murina B123]EMR11598.1 hypothetical protein PNEG_00041 [Pneumocystis murina B123]
MELDENAKDPYFPLANEKILSRLSESIHIFLERRKELWEKNQNIVKIGIEIEHDLLPVESGKNMVKEHTDFSKDFH